MSNEKQCSSASSCDRSSCEGCPSAKGAHQPTDFTAKLNAGSSVKKVIAVVSGKGGVGKSLITGLLASAMQRRNKQCAVLDADITGPSMCKNLGVSGKAQASEAGILPKSAANGLKLVSANMFLPNETDPVVWRGPIISGMVKMVKPDADIYQCLFDTYGLKPEECVFLDDRPENIEGGEKLSMRGIVFKNYEDAKEKLEKILQ